MFTSNKKILTGNEDICNKPTAKKTFLLSDIYFFLYDMFFSLKNAITSIYLCMKVLYEKNICRRLGYFSTKRLNHRAQWRMFFNEP